MQEKTIEAVWRHKVIAILRGLTPEQAVRTAEALYQGGIQLIEVTFNQQDEDGWEETAEAIRRISEKNTILVGAGTVLTERQLELAEQAGARYIISPNTDPVIIHETKKRGLVSIPGALTASEAVTAHQAGADFIKIFPAADMGAGYIKALSAPLSHLKFLAVGGIGESNLSEYLAAGACGVGCGGKLVDKKLIAAEDYDEITKRAKAYVYAAEGEQK